MPLNPFPEEVQKDTTLCKSNGETSIKMTKEELTEKCEEQNLTHDGKSIYELKTMLLDHLRGSGEREVNMSSSVPSRPEMTPQSQYSELERKRLRIEMKLQN